MDRALQSEPRELTEVLLEPPGCREEQGQGREWTDQEAELGQGALKCAGFLGGGGVLPIKSLGLASCHQPVITASQGPHPPARTVLHLTLT